MSDTIKTGSCSIVIGPGIYGFYFPIKKNKLLELEYFDPFFYITYPYNKIMYEEEMLKDKRTKTQTMTMGEISDLMKEGRIISMDKVRGIGDDTNERNDGCY